MTNFTKSPLSKNYFSRNCEYRGSHKGAHSLVGGCKPKYMIIGKSLSTVIAVCRIAVGYSKEAHSAWELGKVT